MTTIAIAILALLAAVMLLLVFSLSLWQKRSNKQLSILQNVETHLKEIVTSLEAAEKRAQENREQEEERTHETPQEQDISHNNIESTLEIGQCTTTMSEKPEAVIEIMEEPILETMEGQMPENENTNRCGEPPASSIYNIGKSGKIYTEEELELLIKE